MFKYVQSEPELWVIHRYTWNSASSGLPSLMSEIMNLYDLEWLSTYWKTTIRSPNELARLDKECLSQTHLVLLHGHAHVCLLKVTAGTSYKGLEITGVNKLFINRIQCAPCRGVSVVQVTECFDCTSYNCCTNYILSNSHVYHTPQIPAISSQCPTAQ